MDTDNTPAAQTGELPVEGGSAAAALLLIPSNVLRGMIRLTPTQDVRYYLTGILCEPDTGTLVTTNGHAMLLYRPAPDEKRPTMPGLAPFIIPRDLAQRGAALAKRSSIPDLEVTVTDRPKEPRLITMRHMGSTVSDGEIDGKFPEWRRIVPHQTSGAPSQFNPQLLETVYTALCEMVGNRSPIVHVSHNGPEGPALVAFAEERRALGIVMPWRGTADGTADAALENIMGVKRPPMPAEEQPEEKAA